MQHYLTSILPVAAATAPAKNLGGRNTPTKKPHETAATRNVGERLIVHEKRHFLFPYCCQRALEVVDGCSVNCHLVKFIPAVYNSFGEEIISQVAVAIVLL